MAFRIIYQSREEYEAEKEERARLIVIGLYWIVSSILFTVPFYYVIDSFKTLSYIFMGFLLLFIVSSLTESRRTKAYIQTVFGFMFAVSAVTLAILFLKNISAGDNIEIKIFAVAVVGILLYLSYNRLNTYTNLFGRRYFKHGTKRPRPPRPNNKKYIWIICILIVIIIFLAFIRIPEISKNPSIEKKTTDSKDEAVIEEKAEEAATETKEIEVVISQEESKTEPEDSATPEKEETMDTEPETTTAIPEIEPIIVEGSSTNVIITNNQDKPINLSVTYRIFSNWFGADYEETKSFEVDANSKKSFRVYDNDGCSHAPCSVSIVSYEEE